ncbi:Pentatricopeptide repeat-containing protein At2g03380, mitochondrial [Linum grandiflorum]
MAILRRFDRRFRKGKDLFFLWENTRSFSYVTTQDDNHSPSTPSLGSISSSSWFHRLSSLTLCNVDIRSLKSIHGNLVVRGMDGDCFPATKLVSLYGSVGLVDVARKVFDGITEPDGCSSKVMARLYFMKGLYREVVDFHEANPTRRCEDDYNVLFSMLLKACSSLKDVNPGRKLHCWIVKSGNPDGYVLTGLVDMYSKCGDIESAREVFLEDNVDRSVVSWTSMISGYVQNDRAEEALILFNRMREEDFFSQANKFTLGCLLTACSKLVALHQGKWIHGYIIKNGIEVNSYLETSLIDMYIKCGSLIDARSALNELSVVPDLVSWTAMIVGYAQGGFPEEALRLFVDKKWESIQPNRITLTSVLSACAQIGWLRFGKSVHCLGVKLGQLDANVVNALIDMYAKNSENLDSFRVFDTLSNKDVVAWNSIVSGYSQNGSAHQAIALFHEMRKKPVLPDAITLVSTFSAFGTLGALLAGSSLHCYSIKVGFFPASVYLGTAILTFYAKCGDAVSPRGVFDEMEEKNIVTWTAMIGGYGTQGDSVASLSLFNTMLKVAKVQPSEAVYTTILSICSHTGLVREGWEIFSSMCYENHNSVPSVKQYACMVDLLARDGMLEEAMELLEEIFPVAVNQQDHVSLLGSFLHGCGLHSRFDLAEVVIKRMLESGSLESCYYVLVCNLYAADGRWGDVEVVREMMKQRGLSKFPGCSQVDDMKC